MDDTVFVHPTALVDTRDVGSRTRVWAYAHLLPGCRVGEDCQICDFAIVGDDAQVGDRVTVKEFAGIGQGVVVEDEAFVGPGVYTPNDAVPRSPRMRGLDAIRKRYEDEANWLSPTRICRGASIGTSAVIAPGVTVGAFAMVALAAVVMRDVAPHALVAGHPARKVGWVCFCGMKLAQEDGAAPWVCPTCERTFVVSDAGLLEPSPR